MVTKVLLKNKWRKRARLVWISLHFFNISSVRGARYCIAGLQPDMCVAVTLQVITLHITRRESLFFFVYLSLHQINSMHGYIYNHYRSDHNKCIDFLH